MELTAQNLEVLQSSHATSSQVDAFIANLQPNSPPASPSLSSEHAASHTSATLASRRSHPTSIPTTSVPRRSARALHQTSTRTSDQRHQLLHNATNKRSKQALSSIDSEHHARLDQRKAKRARQKAIRDGHAQETVRPSKKKRKDMHEKQKQRGTSQKPQSTKAKGKPIGKAKKHSATSEDDQASVQHLKDRKSELERTAFKRQRRKMVNVNQNRITVSLTLLIPRITCDGLH